MKLGKAYAEETPGVTATEIKIGNTVAYSGPASSVAGLARVEAAYFRSVNEKDGIAGRKINFISLDDAYSPPKTVEQTRKLVEQEGVAFMFSSTGTAPNTAVRKYLNDRGIPQLFIFTGADKFTDYKQFPWTISSLPSYRTEAQIFAKYALAHSPGAGIGILYQNDDFGRDYVAGFKDVLGDRFAAKAKLVTCESTDPTVDSQIVSLYSAGVTVLMVVAVGTLAAQAIRKVYDIAWKPALFFLSSVDSSVSGVIKPAGQKKAVGIITAQFLKDPMDPAWAGDPEVQEWRNLMARYLPNADLSDLYNVYGYFSAEMLHQVLKQCGDDFSRTNIMKKATNLHELALPMLLPGIKANTAPTNYRPIRQMQLARWNGDTWKRFGELIEGSGI